MSSLEKESPKMKVGLEIHRQVDTEHKLFCSCPTDFAESEPESKFLRRLRPTQSELGQIDQAALFEFHRGKSILYESEHHTSCLVEMDEEPPGKLNARAVEVCLTAALLLNAKPVEEIHVMRKVVIDGSNTTGFQRTSVVALDGTLTVGEKEVPIQQISLEEDAARKTSQSREIAGFRIDRLGVPLVEVTTGPVIESPSEAERVALAIGTILRATRKVKRGLGSIRQDLNISITGGALIEIKGVQELDLVGKAVDLEVNRQQELLKIKDELSRRQVKTELLERKYVDLSDIFRGTKAHVIKEALANGGIVLGVKLSKFGGLLGRELAPGLRLGTELSNRASFWAGVGGIFHTDELPGYGITQEEVAQAREKMNLDLEDALVLVADEPSRASDALDAVLDRAQEALVGVPEETRMAMPDGTTRYMRPRPGAARMYPETDVPPTPVTEQLIAELKDTLPETTERIVQRLVERFSINEKLARQLVDSDYLKLFEQIAATSKVQASFIATVLSENCKSLEREGYPIHDILDQTIEAIFRLVDEGVVTKEAVGELLKWQSKNPRSDPRSGVKELGLRMITEQELDEIISRHIEKNRKLTEQKGAAAFSSLMGSVMSEVRGSIEPKVVAEKLKEKLRKLQER
jgi:glutamyl-tRNA(Gln) amidotransferase subunit E